ncbi:MFS quinate transporter QutD [Pseudomassariella vexata]|uniref:Quinate transporter n=1 Tax=Pseudomassariella vexata TaxID=1141098 RepID=A0A1Y2DQP5_9PEZI|nr:MFS quinate transporter QutD [Pseudomassariella vexata]ORY61590.1 MFS quinate transporter QutD [Pseudomassariella vexata]
MKNPFLIVEDPIRPVPKAAYGWRIYTLAISASWATAMNGYDVAFIGGTLALPSFQQEYGFKQGTEAYTSFSSNLISIFVGGCFFGGLIGYYFSEVYGRKKQLIGSGMVFAVGATMQVLNGGKLSLLYIGRVATGLGVGASAMCAPIYIAESSPPPIRGRLVGIFDICLEMFACIGFWINYGVERTIPPSRKQCQVPFAVQLIPAGLLLVSMPFMKESPRWLARQGRVEEARKVLSYVYHLPEDHPYVQMEIGEMQAHIDREAQMFGRSFWKSTWKEAAKAGIRNRIILAVCLKVLMSFTGVQAINYYSPRVFQSIGLRGTSTQLLVTGFYGQVKFFSALAAIVFAIDSLGRRPLLIFGSVGCLIPMFYLGTYSKISNSFNSSMNEPDTGGYVAVVMTFLFAISFAVSWLSPPRVFASEIFPNRVRSLGFAVSMSASWIAQFIVVYSAPYMIARIQFGMFFFYGSCTTFAVMFVYLFVPETKGVSMEHMDFIFNGSVWGLKARRDAEEKIAQHEAIIMGIDAGIGTSEDKESV